MYDLIEFFSVMSFRFLPTSANAFCQYKKYDAHGLKYTIGHFSSHIMIPYGIPCRKYMDMSMYVHLLLSIFIPHLTYMYISDLGIRRSVSGLERLERNLELSCIFPHLRF